MQCVVCKFESPGSALSFGQVRIEFFNIVMLITQQHVISFEHAEHQAVMYFSGVI